MRKVALLLLLVTLVPASLSADPPPYPRYSVKNETPWTISGNFTARYVKMGDILFNESVTLSGSLAPGQTFQRQVPHRMPHLCGNASYPCIFVVFRDHTWTVNGTPVSHILRGFGSNPCGYTGGDRAVSPGDSNAAFGPYQTACIKMSCSGGSGDANAQDYFDCRIHQ